MISMLIIVPIKVNRLLKQFDGSIDLLLVGNIIIP